MISGSVTFQVCQFWFCLSSNLFFLSLSCSELYDRKPDPTQAMFLRLLVSWLLTVLKQWEALVGDWRAVGRSHVVFLPFPLCLSRFSSVTTGPSPEKSTFHLPQRGKPSLWTASFLLVHLIITGASCCCYPLSWLTYAACLLSFSITSVTNSLIRSLHV